MTGQETAVSGPNGGEEQTGRVDLTRLPTGEMGWAALIGWLIESDDRVERYFLEVKSAVDLNIKADRAKVAKFILGAANRDPEQARRRFSGHALMILGIGDGRVVGVPSFEAKDLAGAVQKWVGVGGPRWDFERIRSGGHDVIVIVVDPPTGDLWTCRADGDGLIDGGIYVRQDGETRQAKGDEVRQLVERATRKGSRVDVDVDVAIEGPICAIQIDKSRLIEYVSQRAAGLRAQLDRERSVHPFTFDALTTDRRSREEFLEQVSTWEKETLESPTVGVVALAARVLEGIYVRLHNRTRTFMRDVRVDILFEDEIVATEWEYQSENDPIDLFPTMPSDWGSEIWNTSLGNSDLRSLVASAPVDGGVEIKRETPAMLAMNMKALRPEEDHIGDLCEVVLIMFAESPPESITARWRVTAQDVNDVLEGTAEIPVLAFDWRDKIAKLMKGADEDEDDSAADD
ncbi:hypothetical protein [Catellatospora tritici]|uniref:hypothetical protein n=1 Tax=Catellatospora tritici TaxID=2851566 RepID=UPI001C2D53A0|nr:hypothetical protein [Catellatospora tritici]MBV1855782.1 hypothetical protein [Catellatospora tritici]